MRLIVSYLCCVLHKERAAYLSILLSLLALFTTVRTLGPCWEYNDSDYRQKRTKVGMNDDPTRLSL